jgi:hypothetical protein
MGRGLELTLGVLAAIANCGLAVAQDAAIGSEKPLLVAALQEIQERVRRVHEAPGNSGLYPAVNNIYRSARWFENATSRWSPKQTGEGRPLLDSLERMLQALRRAPASGDALRELLLAISEDLSVKEDHCRQKGLAAPQRVTVVTRRNGLEEVKGLAVLYIEKFFASDPNARPHEFRRFSSPAVDDLVPGRYILWSRETAGAGRDGKRKEARIGGGGAEESIEVLAP